MIWCPNAKGCHYVFHILNFLKTANIINKRPISLSNLQPTFGSANEGAKDDEDGGDDETTNELREQPSGRR